MTVSLSEAQAEALYHRNVVINTLDCTPAGFADEQFVGQLVRSGVTAVNIAASYSEGTEGALRSLGAWHQRIRENPGVLFSARTLDDIPRAKRDGQIAVYFGFEDAAPIADKPWMLDVFYELGLRFLGLTYQYRNLAADGCGEPADAGLSRFGIDLIGRCNELGVVLDLSHTGERSTLETIGTSRVPVIVSHAGLCHFVDSPRNKSDAVIKALAERGGVIGIAAKSGFLRADGLVTRATVDDVVTNIAYVADSVGIDHVVIGTDLGDLRKYSKEGMARVRERYPDIPIIGPDLDLERVHPDGLASPGELGNLAPALAARGFSAGEIEKVIGGNMLRVLAACWTATPSGR
jgi:membrane dipeptidase